MKDKNGKASLKGHRRRGPPRRRHPVPLADTPRVDAHDEVSNDSEKEFDSPPEATQASRSATKSKPRPKGGTPGGKSASRTPNQLTSPQAGDVLECTGKAPEATCVGGTTSGQICDAMDQTALDKSENSDLLKDDLEVPDVLDVDDLDSVAVDAAFDGGGPTPLSLLRVQEGETHLVRLVSRKVPWSHVHFGLRGADGRYHSVRCNAGPGRLCALCLADHEPQKTGFVLVYSIRSADLSVLSFDLGGGSWSMRAHLVPLLKRPDRLDLIIRVAKRGGRFQVGIAGKVGDLAAKGLDMGNDVLADILDDGGPTNDEVRSVYDQLENRELLDAFPSLATEICVLHPEVDLKDL